MHSTYSDYSCPGQTHKQKITLQKPDIVIFYDTSPGYGVLTYTSVIHYIILKCRKSFKNFQIQMQTSGLLKKSNGFNWFILIQRYTFCITFANIQSVVIMWSRLIALTDRQTEAGQNTLHNAAKNWYGINENIWLTRCQKTTGAHGPRVLWWSIGRQWQVDWRKWRRNGSGRGGWVTLGQHTASTRHSSVLYDRQLW